MYADTYHVKNLIIFQQFYGEACSSGMLLLHSNKYQATCVYLNSGKAQQCVVLCYHSIYFWRLPYKM